MRPYQWLSLVDLPIKLRRKCWEASALERIAGISRVCQFSKPLYWGCIVILNIKIATWQSEMFKIAGSQEVTCSTTYYE